MFQEYFSAMSSTLLPLVAMAFFLVAFLLVLARTFLQHRKTDYDAVAGLPLHDDEPHDANEVRP